MKRSAKAKAWRRAMMFNAIYGSVGGVVMMAAATITLYHA